MARELSKRKLRAQRRQTCVHGHHMLRRDRSAHPECYSCDMPVCVKHVMWKRVPVSENYKAMKQFCSMKCFNVACIEAALVHGSEQLRVEGF